ncbi:uncharacterized protein LOC143437508 [Arvicanthis niloticus]|uniref:uncharacterized protein LOC117698042 n=1 Tax=Arvicanthis niloticus TaxID=61156 RepID=UPI001485D74F|nr:translation initiation factor IF-2-like [Arvicanthis niloticus]
MRSAAKGAGRTGHAAPSPDPARAGGRGRPRGGPAGGRPAGSSPRRPARIKPGARPGARGGGGAGIPPSLGVPVCPGGERGPLIPGAGSGLGRGRTPHPRRGGPSHGERPPGMKRFPALPGSQHPLDWEVEWRASCAYHLNLSWNLRTSGSLFRDTPGRADLPLEKDISHKWHCTQQPTRDDVACIKYL